MLTGSLKATAPAGIEIAGCPPKVICWSVPGTIIAPLACRAILAAPMRSGARPNALDSRTRRRDPPTLTRTMWRIVWFSNGGGGAANVVPGGTGDALQVAIQCGMAASVAAPSTVDAATTRLVARTSSLFIWVLLDRRRTA